MHLVQVCLKNLVRAVVAFQQHRHRRSIERAVPGLLAGQEEILDQLLRQRAAALHDVACAQIGDAGTKDRLDADAGMRIEAVVLDRDQSLRQQRRHVAELDQHAVLALLRIDAADQHRIRSEEHTSELQSLMRISYAVFCLKKKKKKIENQE